MRIELAFVIACGLSACGGEVAPASGVSSADDARADVVDVAEASVDADDGRQKTDALPTCHADLFIRGECPANSVCWKPGVCCSGTFVAGRCVCGDGPGCDVFHLCCQPWGHAGFDDAGRPRLACKREDSQCRGPI